MTLLAQGPTEDTTRKLLATTLAAMEQKSWTDARQKLRQLQAHVETTSSTSVSKADLLAMEEKVALGEWNNVVVKARAGTVLKTLKTTTSAPLVAMSPDGKYVLAGYSGKLCLYDVISGTTLKTFDGSAPSFHPKGTLVFVKKADDELTLFEIPSGKEAQSWGKEKYLNRVVFSPDGGLAFGFGGGKEMKLWNVGSGKLVPAFAGKTAESLIYCAAFSPDGRYLLTGGTSVQLWEIATGKLIRELGAAPPSGSTIQNRALAVGFSTDGASAYVCWFIEGRVVGWEITTGKEVKNFQAVANPNGRPDGAVFSSSGRFVMTKDNVTLRVFDIESGKQVHTFPVPRYTPSFGFSRDELLGFYGDGHRGTVSLLKIWDGDRPPAPPLKR
jgi:WD40 repeat protein